jgi:WD40 repeat protein
MKSLILLITFIAVSTASQARQQNAAPEIVLQAGISSPQTQISFSPDGRLLASMGMTGNAIKLWEVSTGRLLRHLESSIPAMGASSLTRPFRFSANGQMLTAFADGKITRWDVESGREVSSTVMPATKDVMTALLSDDGRIVAALTIKSSLRVWDGSTAQELRPITFADGENFVTQEAFALSPNGKLVALLTETVKASRRGVERKTQVSVWDVATGRRVQALNAPSAATRLGGSKFANLGFSSDGTWLALRDEATFRIWDVAAGREVKSFASPGTTAPDPIFMMFASKFLFSPDRRMVSFVTEGNKMNLVDSSSASRLHSFAGHNGSIVGMSFSGDGKLIASSGADNQIKIWDTTAGTEIRTLNGSAMPVNDLSFSSDGKSLALASTQATTLWDLNASAVRQAVVAPAGYARKSYGGLFDHPAILSRGGKWLAAGNDTTAVVKIWDVVTGHPLPDLSLTQDKQLGNAAFSADGKLVALVEQNRQAGTGPALAIPAQPITIPDMSKMMELMQKDPKKMQEEMKKLQDAMQQGDMSAGFGMMQQLAIPGLGTGSGRSANTLRIVEVASGRQLHAIPLPGGLMNQGGSGSPMSASAVSFNADGSVVAFSSGLSSPISLRAVATGQELRSLKTNLSMGVYALAWSPDGARLASAQWGLKKNILDPNAADDFSFDDMTFGITVWDAQTGMEVAKLAGHNNFTNALAFSRDGRTLASGSYDSTIKLWDIATGRELQTMKGHTGSVVAIEFSPDGKFVVSGGEDGSARLWSVGTGALTATMVSLNKGEDWLVVTPDGLFDGSPAGWNQILWRFSQRLSDVSPVEIFFNEYFYPGLLSDILAGKTVKAAAGDIAQKDRRQAKLNLVVDNADTTAAIATKIVNIHINITEAAAGARDVRLFRNGSLVKAWSGDVSTDSSTPLQAQVSIVAGANQITAYAFNRDNVKSADATIFITGADSLKRSGTLHLIVVGINEYENSGYNLKYAVADAQAFASTIADQQKKLGIFANVQITPLMDRDATKANLLDAIRKLRAEPEDAVILYYAGHGTAQGQHFYLIPHDLGYKGGRTELDPAGLNTMLSHSISDIELEQALQTVDAGHMLMVIDACNSGQALEAEEKRRGPMNSKGLAQLAYEKGIYILTAAQSYQAALEAEQLGHGYLTFALVEEGLKTAAADVQPNDGIVILREWLDYATARVPKMQEANMQDTRNLTKVSVVEAEDSVQKPRVFYRREREASPMVVAKP